MHRYCMILYVRLLWQVLYVQVYRHAHTGVFTSEVISGPEAEDTGSTSVLVKHKLVVLAGSASPTAAHLSFTDHLHTHTHVNTQRHTYSHVDTQTHTHTEM